MLDPDVVLRADGGTARARQTVVIHGARAVAEQAVTGTRFAPVRATSADQRNRRSRSRCGRAGVVGHGFTVAHGKIVAIDVLYDPERLADLDLAVFDDSP